MEEGMRGWSPETRRRVTEIRMEGHALADKLNLVDRPGYLSVEIIVRKSKDVKIDPDRMDEFLDRKWQEIFTEISSLIEGRFRSDQE